MDRNKIYLKYIFKYVFISKKGNNNQVIIFSFYVHYMLIFETWGLSIKIIKTIKNEYLNIEKNFMLHIKIGIIEFFIITKSLNNMLKTFLIIFSIFITNILCSGPISQCDGIVCNTGRCFLEKTGKGYIRANCRNLPSNCVCTSKCYITKKLVGNCPECICP